MIGTTAGVRITIPIVGNTDVSHLRMQQAMEQFAVDQASSADACADGQVDERVQALGGAPAVFAQGCYVHVRIKAYRHTQGPLNSPAKLVCAQPGLGVVVM